MNELLMSQIDEYTAQQNAPVNDGGSGIDKNSYTPAKVPGSFSLTRWLHDNWIAVFVVLTMLTLLVAINPYKS